MGRLAERYFADDPKTCLIKLRQFGEILLQEVAARVVAVVEAKRAKKDVASSIEQSERYSRSYLILSRPLLDWMTPEGLQHLLSLRALTRFAARRGGGEGKFTVGTPSLAPQRSDREEREGWGG
ncbi:hypothetical protein L6R29_26140 [Myxococcota bacterium]|nr:hypothetical protein [Myxococcota bacterium]